MGCGGVEGLLGWGFLGVYYFRFYFVFRNFFCLISWDDVVARGGGDWEEGMG